MNSTFSFLKLFITCLGVSGALAACSAAQEPTTTTDEVEADQLEVVHGTPDHEQDPAVVAIDIGEKALCTGALIAPDVVLTARHCVAMTSEQIACPPSAAQTMGMRDASSLRILVGDDVSSAQVVAQGREIVAPPGTAICDSDIALIILDRPVEGVPTLDVRDSGVTTGDHVRAVGYGRIAQDGPAGQRLVREHVRVLETSAHEFVVGEATCQGDSGGPAIDEESGEIVGIVSRGGPECDGASAHNIYTRTDAFLDMIDEALAKSRAPADDGKAPGHASAHGRGHRDAGRTVRHGRGTHRAKKPATDIGGTCGGANECSAGVCVKGRGKDYCSRSCDAHDRCPSQFECRKSRKGASVCVER